ncbi:ArsR/SmtB family transcription factor [Streptodolium elevatio]|uniref:ArsR/SmtB family transcription factor n=1 Tax=Streptodolium elevatio TaxID=3157996 RepID=UPI003F4D5DF5
MTDTSKTPDGPRRGTHTTYGSSDPDAAVLDAKGLRALAHPVRVQLVGLLRKHGPSTATRLAERLGVNSGTASYHLRQLGAAGFVEEDTGLGNARERWWRAVHQVTELRDHDLAALEPDATLAYLRSVAATYTVRTQQTLNSLPSMPREWREGFDMSDWALRLTPAEAVALRAELNAVLDRHRRDLPDTAADAPEGARRVGVIALLLPELDTPESDTGPDPAAGAKPL